MCDIDGCTKAVKGQLVGVPLLNFENPPSVPAAATTSCRTEHEARTAHSITAVSANPSPNPRPGSVVTDVAAAEERVEEVLGACHRL
jgi:cell division septation protein DedD